MDAKQQALAIIRGEHRSLTAVVEALKHVSAEMAAGKLTADFKLLWSILYYIEEYPERLHHPKEESVLFPKLRARTREIDEVLDELGRQHANSRPHLDVLKSLLGRIEAEIPGALAEFAEKADTYAAFHWAHMTQEETLVLPKAIEVFTAEDWIEVAAAFADNQDPMQDGGVGVSDWFRQFFRRIVTLVPEPWGVGARH